MAKRRRRKGGIAVLPFQAQLSLGTLANGTVLSVPLLSGNLTEDLFIISIDSTMVIRDLTAGEGPLYMGFAHSDYSVAEIAEAIDTSGYLGPSAKIEQEQARRLVRRWGTFRGHEATSIIAESNGGHRRYKVRWVQQNGGNPRCWLQNTSGVTLTTGAVLETDGYIYGRWLQ